MSMKTHLMNVSMANSVFGLIVLQVIYMTGKLKKVTGGNLQKSKINTAEPSEIEYAPTKWTR